jgi:hypothetical protein
MEQHDRRADPFVYIGNPPAVHVDDLLAFGKGANRRVSGPWNILMTIGNEIPGLSRSENPEHEEHTSADPAM